MNGFYSFPRDRNYHAEVNFTQYLTRGNQFIFASGGQTRYHTGQSNSFAPAGNSLSLVGGRLSFSYFELGEPATMNSISTYIITNGGVGSTCELSLFTVKNGLPDRLVLLAGNVDASASATLRVIPYIQKLKAGYYCPCIIASATTVIPGIPPDNIAQPTGVSSPDNLQDGLYPWIAAGVYATAPQTVDKTKLQMAGTRLQPMIALTFIN